MRIYLSGLKLEASTKLMIRKGVHKLCSYAYPEQLETYVQYIKEINPEKKGTLMIDSGAFTMWSKRKSVNIDRYIDYCKKQIDKCHSYFTEIYVINLDVIPGQHGRKATRQELEDSAIEGWKNFEYIRSKGIEPMHIFHAGENFKWLHRLAKESLYIGISPSNDYSGVQKIEWLKEVYQNICDANGECKVKTHGFGVTRYELLKIFPWFSVDSASWSLTSGYGGISTPWGKFNTSLRQSSSSNFLDKYPTHLKDTVKNWMKDNNIDWKDAYTDYKKRDEINILYYLWLEEHITNKNIKYTQKQMSFL